MVGRVKDVLRLVGAGHLSLMMTMVAVINPISISSPRPESSSHYRKSRSEAAAAIQEGTR